MKSNMQHDFSMIPRADIQRSKFRCIDTYKTTIDAGILYPFYADEVVPGDTFDVKAQIFGRLATPLHPIMDNLYLDTHYFYVPNRLLWDHWHAFIGEQDDPMDPVEYIVPEINSGEGFAQESIFDYFGIPTKVGNLDVNALHLRAYNLIYNEWYRDQNLIDKVTVETGDTDVATNYQLLPRGKRHDYFTSCLPWPQKGEAVNVPIGGYAPVVGNGNSLGLTDGYENFGLYQDPAFTQKLTGVWTTNIGVTLPGAGVGGANPTASSTAIGVVTDPDESGLIADLSSATAYTVNEIRMAIQLQKMLERDARGGTRACEIIRSHFGVVVPDMRIQRPEYLGGSTCRINTYPVQQQSESTATGKLGDLGAFAIGADTNGFYKSFVEHGVIIGIMSIRADITYQQGLHRMWSRHTKYDFLWPALAMIGEQAVLEQEIYAQNGSLLAPDGTPMNEGVFGYQERYAEYRYGKSQVTGLFRSNHSASLDSWHLSQNLSAPPLLNETFINDATGDVLDRCIAVPSQPQFIMDCYIEANKARPLPTYSVPGLMDHF